MKLLRLLVAAFLLSITFGCESPEGPMWDPPYWEGAAGITNAIPCDGSVIVKWEQATHDYYDDYRLRYRIHMSEDENPFDERQIDTVDTYGSYTVYGLTNGVEYSFGIKALTPAGQIDSNTEVLFATPRVGQCGDIDPPVWDDTVGVIQIEPFDRLLRVSWGSATDAETPPVEYLVYFSENENVWNETPINLYNTFHYDFSALVNGEKYYAGVRCQDNVVPPNVDTNSVIMSGIPGEANPDTVPPVWDTTIGIVDAVAGDGEITAYWGTATDADTPPVSYLLYIAEDNQPWNRIPVILSDNTPHTFTGLDNGTPYYLTVRCQDSVSPANIDNNTVIRDATPMAPADTDPPVWDSTVGLGDLGAGVGEITAYWFPATDAETPPVEYLLYIDINDDPWDQIPIIRSSNAPYTFTGLDEGRMYWVGVRCQDSVVPPNVDTNTVVGYMETQSSVDNEPPVWVNQVGIYDLFPAKEEATVFIGLAEDVDNPPVEYLLYVGLNEDTLWNETPVIRPNNDPYTFENLTSGLEYFFGARCRDSAVPPNTDDNDVIWSSVIP